MERLLDQVGHRLGLGDHDHVRALDLENVGTRALGHGTDDVAAGGKRLAEQGRVDGELCRRLGVLTGRILALDQGRVEDAVLGVGLDLSQAFAFVGGEGGDKDQANDACGGGGGVGDNRPVVGAADLQQRRAVPPVTACRRSSPLST
jgi:hypothetical protein